MNLTQVMLAEGATIATALVFCGGGPVRRPIPRLDDPFVVAADSGVVEAQRLGVPVDLLIGDLDSAPPDAVERARASGARVECHPAAKDASDLELALEAARREGATDVLVVGGDGGRLDHTLANALVLASSGFADLRIDAVMGAALLHVIRGVRELEGTPGEPVSLFALGGPARGVRTRGLRFPLDAEDLLPGSTRGLSNELVAARASVWLDEGVIVAIRPGGDPS
jgi:thiamine pyrophosphokinase